MVRFALLGCLAAGLAFSAPALATDEGGLEPESETLVRKPRPKRLVKRVALLPPERPAEFGPAQPVRQERAPPPAEQAGAAVSAAQPAATAEPPPKTDLQALPPLRRSFVDAPQFAMQVSPGAPAALEIAHPMPPSRPDFAEVESPAVALVAMLPPRRPAFVPDPDPIETASLPDAPAARPEAAPQPTRPLFGSLFGVARPNATPAPAPVIIDTGRPALDARIAHHAQLNQVPVALVHRVVIRESRYNPAAVGRGGALGLMQIKHATARGVGYNGPASGLLDAETNLTYAVRYLAGAYRLAAGDYDRAVRHYARGYYYEMKRQRGRLATRSRSERLEANAASVLEAPPGPAAPAPSLATQAR
jgi:soluble lytic murein transglycosylase-like protein